MYLKVTSPDKTIFAGNIVSASIPTEAGEVTIMKNHIPLMSILRPGIMKIQPEELLTVSLIKDAEFLFQNHKIHLSVSHGLVYIDGKNVTILANDVTINPKNTQEVLQQMKNNMLQEVEELKSMGNIEEAQKKLIEIEKINADMKLVQIRQES